MRSSAQQGDQDRVGEAGVLGASQDSSHTEPDLVNVAVAGQAQVSGGVHCCHMFCGSFLSSGCF